MMLGEQFQEQNVYLQRSPRPLHTPSTYQLTLPSYEYSLLLAVNLLRKVIKWVVPSTPKQAALAFCPKFTGEGHQVLGGGWWVKAAHGKGCGGNLTPSVLLGSDHVP